METEWERTNWNRQRFYAAAILTCLVLAVHFGGRNHTTNIKWNVSRVFFIKAAAEWAPACGTRNLVTKKMEVHYNSMDDADYNRVRDFVTSNNCVPFILLPVYMYSLDTPRRHQRT